MVKKKKKKNTNESRRKYLSDFAIKSGERDHSPSSQSKRAKFKYFAVLICEG